MEQKQLHIIVGKCKEFEMKKVMLMLIVLLSVRCIAIDIWMDVDVDDVIIPVNLMPLSTDGTDIDAGVTYDEAGMDLVWNFVTSVGVYTQTVVTPLDGGAATDYDWVAAGNGMYTIQIPSTSGASISNDTEGTGWFTGETTATLPWRGPVIGFRAAGINDSLIDGADNIATQAQAGTKAALEAGTADMHINSLEITPSASGTAVTITANTDGYGAIFTGAGAKAGIRSVGGGTDGSGIQAVGGATNGIGFDVDGTGSGHGATFTGGASDNADGIYVTSAATNADAVTFLGKGTGMDFKADNLEYLLGYTTSIAADADLSSIITAGSVYAHIMSIGASVGTAYNATESSMQAAGTHLDAIETDTAAIDIATSKWSPR